MKLAIILNTSLYHFKFSMPMKKVCAIYFGCSKLETWQILMQTLTWMYEIFFVKLKIVNAMAWSSRASWTLNWVVGWGWLAGWLAAVLNWVGCRWKTSMSSFCRLACTVREALYHIPASTFSLSHKNDHPTQHEYEALASLTVVTITK